MLIAIDARTVYAATRRGIGKTLVALYREVARMRPGWGFVMFHRGQGNDDPFGDLPNVSNRKIEIKGDRLGLWSRWRLPWAVRRAKADLVHCPANRGPRRAGAPMVLTIHDVIPMAPELGEGRDGPWARSVGQAARAAAHIVTPSEYSKGRIVEAFGVPPERVTVNPWAADSKYHKVEDPAELARVRSAYGIADDQGWILAFSGRDPRKNARRIVQAYALLRPDLRNRYALVIIGLDGGLQNELQGLAERNGVCRGISLNQFAPEADIAPLLSGATALCYPSLSEGFGLPVLDAFACETAVLTSNVTSLPEVAGDAALLVDPRNVDAIAEGLEQLLADEALRGQMVARGIERVKDYTWEGCAERMCRVFEEIVRDHAGIARKKTSALL
jgi:alpha-1,3-rhamnosyl/mannosyltransferase